MKGLVAKDCALFMQRKRFFLFAAALAIIIAACTDSRLFVMLWLVMLVGIFSISTISYDDYDNSMPFLMTMPVSGKIYAAEKYVFLLLLEAAATIISAAIILSTSLIKKEVYSLSEDFAGAILIIALTTVFIAVIMPAMLKWGTEKGRLVLLVAAGVVGVIVYFGDRMYNVPDPDMIFSSLGIYKTAGLAAGAAAVVFIISLIISIRVMENKEF